MCKTGHNLIIFAEINHFDGLYGLDFKIVISIRKEMFDVLQRWPQAVIICQHFTNGSLYP